MTVSGDRRRHARTPVNWPATCIAEDGTRVDVTIVDASIGGFCLDRAIPIVDAHFILAIHQIGTFPCRIAWRKADQCGIELLIEFGQPSDGELRELAKFL